MLAALVGVTAAGAWYYDRRHQVAVGDVTIIDADTIKTTAKGRIRFKHCDAPEWFQTGGEVAAQRLIALTDGRRNQEKVTEPWRRNRQENKKDSDDGCCNHRSPHPSQ